MSESLTVCCFQWNNGFRKYLPEYVNVLARGVKRHLHVPHRFVCVTEETEGFSDDVEVFPLPDAAKQFANLPSPEGPRFPSSYRRLWAFSKEARVLGDRIMMLDIDAVITDEITPLFDPDDDFIGWVPSTLWGRKECRRIGGGTWLLRTGTRTEVWEKFNRESARSAHAKGWRGSDQGWLSYCLAAHCAVWSKDAGIFQSADVRRYGRTQADWNRMPTGARIVHFNGPQKPWQLLHIPWIRQHWV